MDLKLQRGPTIPFILGSCKEPLTSVASPTLGEPDLRRLLAAMRDETPEPYCIEILLCPYLKPMSLQRGSIRQPAACRFLRLSCE